MNNYVNELSEAWKRAIDSDVIKAATQDWGEYPPHAQATIEAEAKNRGLWEKVLFLRGKKTSESISKEANIEGYVCEGCKGTYLNFETGRCAKCDLPSGSIGYCIECDKFWPLPIGSLCPTHNRKLSRYKAALALLRLGNDLLDMAVFRILLYPIVFVGAFCLVRSGLVSLDAITNINPLLDWIIGLSLLFLYYVITETMWQRSPAKFITGTKVTNMDGTKPSMAVIAKRTLIRFIPFEAFSFLGEKVRGWHDRWTDTYVVKAKRFRSSPSEQFPLSTQNIVSEKSACPTSSTATTNVLSNRAATTLDSNNPAAVELEICANCDTTISRLEQAHIFKNNVVCASCYERLKRQEFL